MRTMSKTPHAKQLPGQGSRRVGRQPVVSTASLEQLIPGTELIVKHRLYWHHGIYAGKSRVIQYAGWFHSAHGLIEEVSLEEFTKGRGFGIGQRPADHHRGEEIVRRARSRLGEQCYDLLRNNCEHFCNWCHLGQARSGQVEALSKPEFLLYAIVQGVRTRLGQRAAPASTVQTVMA